MGKGNKFWLDDPEWEVLRRKAEKLTIPRSLKQQTRPRAKLRLPERQPSANAPKESSAKEVTLNLRLTIPKIKLPDFKLLYKHHRKTILRSGIVLTAIAVVLMGINALSGSKSKSKVSNNSAKQSATQAKPDFNPLVPLENFGASGKPDIKYDSEKKVLGYATNYTNASMIVSQQALPEQIKSGKTNLAAIAKSINAQKTIQTQKGPAHTATDAKTNEQTLVFATKEVLVFIKSNKPLPDEDWRLYVNQLNPAQ